MGAFKDSLVPKYTQHVLFPVNYEEPSLLLLLFFLSFIKQNIFKKITKGFIQNKKWKS